MAVYNLDNYLEKDGLGFPLNFRRGNPNPLDNSSVWAVLSAAKDYAANDPTAYVGQPITVVYSDEEKTILDPIMYIIADINGTLVPVGRVPVGDHKTIHVKDDGTVSLYGISDITDTTKKYQPVLIDGELSWQEVSATTIEGLDTSIKAIESEIDTLQEDIADVQDDFDIINTVIGNSEGGLVKSVADNTGNITTLLEKVTQNEQNISNVTTRVETAESEIDALQIQIGGLTGAMHFAGVVDTVPANDAEGYSKGDVVVISANAEANAHKEYVYDGSTWHELGDEGSHITKTEVANTYETKSDATSKKTELEGKITAEAERAAAAERANADSISNISTKVTALEQVKAEKNTIATVDTAQFAIDENRNLTLLDIAMSKVTGLEEALGNKVDAEEGKRLITEDEGSKLDKIILNGDGSIKVDGAIDASNVENLSSWITENRDTVTGLLSASDAEIIEKLKDVEAGAEVNDISSITIAGSDTALPIIDKVVDIPKATSEQYGVVRGSAEENKVSVNDDGTMEVNSINVNKLSQTTGEFIILNGGTSAN